MISNVEQTSYLFAALLKDSEGNFLKPNPTKQEIFFYNTVTKSQDPVLEIMKQFIPTYLGTKNVDVNGKGSEKFSNADQFSYL